MSWVLWGNIVEGMACGSSSSIVSVLHGFIWAFLSVDSIEVPDGQVQSQYSP